MELAELSTVVVLTGIIVVFLILAILTWATIGYSRLISFISNSIKNKTKTDNTIRSNRANRRNQLPLQDNTPNNEEIAAVIASAIYHMDSDSNSKYIIKSITPSKKTNTFSRWNFAGLLENTNSFKL